MIKPVIITTFNITGVAVLIMWPDVQHVKFVAAGLLSVSMTLAVLGLVGGRQK